jgi:hypothetical protein
VTTTGISDLARVFEDAGHIDVAISWWDPKVPSKADRTRLQATVPGYADAANALAKLSKRRRTLTLQFLDRVVMLHKKLPANWAELLAQFDACLTTVRKLEASTKETHGTPAT